MANVSDQSGPSVHELNALRRDYLEAKRKLLAAETMYEASTGKKHPGSPLVHGSLADIARDFILDLGHPLTYIQIRSLFQLNYVPFTESALKKALKQASKGPAMVRLNTDDVEKSVEAHDEFDARRTKA